MTEPATFAYLMMAIGIVLTACFIVGAFLSLRWGFLFLVGEGWPTDGDTEMRGFPQEGKGFDDLAPASSCRLIRNIAGTCHES